MAKPSTLFHSLPPEPAQALAHLKTISPHMVEVFASVEHEAGDAINSARHSGDTLRHVLDEVEKDDKDGDLFLFAIVPIGRVKTTAHGVPLEPRNASSPPR
jgi:hypothetical protein